MIKVNQTNDVAQTLKPLGSITTTCMRKPEPVPTQIDGVTYDCTKETIFVIATSGPVRAVKIPRVCSQTIEPSRADRIEKQVAEATGRLQSQVDSLSAGLNEVTDRVNAVAGIHLQREPEQPYAVTGGAQSH